MSEMATWVHEVSDDGKWCRAYDVADLSHFHLYPVGDQVLHEFDVDGDCVCGPEQRLVKDADGDDAWLFTHSALDGRPLPEERR